MSTVLCHRGLEDDEGVHTMESEEDEFAAIQRNAEILKSVRSLSVIYYPPEVRSMKYCRLAVFM